MAWWSVCSAMFYIFVAASLATHFGAVNAIIGMLVTVVIYALINYPLAKYAIRTGLSTLLLSRLLFGRRGAVLATVLLGLTAIYYAVFEGSVLAITVTKVAPSVSYVVACVIVVLCSVPLVIGSVQHRLSRFSAILLPIYLGGLALLVYLAGTTYGFSMRWLDVGPAGIDTIRIANCVAAYVGIFVLMMVTVDFSRLGQPSDAEFHARFSFGAPFYLVTYFLNGVVGIFVVGTVQAAEISEVAVVDATLLVLGPLVGLAFIWATQTRINATNFYVSTVNFEAVVESLLNLRWPRVVYALAVGGVVFALMASTDVFSGLLMALQYQSIFVTAWVALALQFVLADRREAGEVHAQLDAAPEIEHRGLIAWIAGAACGLIAAHLPGVIPALPPLLSFMVPVLVYSLLRRRS